MGLRRALWTPEEDEKLKAYIKRYGIWNWSKMPEPAGLLRSGNSCRLRWMNYIRPGLKLGNFTMEENETIIRMQNMLGNRWCKIAAVMPGRTDNEIKNHWHTNSKKLVDKPAGDDGEISTDAANSESPIESPQAEMVDSSSLYTKSIGNNSTASMETCKTDPVIVENYTGFEDFWVNMYFKYDEEACVYESEIIGSHSDMWADPICLISPCDIFSDESISDDLLGNHCDSIDIEGLVNGSMFHF